MLNKILGLSAACLFLFSSPILAQAEDDLYAGFEVGTVIDSMDGVKVYYNGDWTTVVGRNTTRDGYNLGLKYQCVEFVKRYYYEHFKHKMPDSYGHAKDFYNKNLADGAWNKARGLRQYKNGSASAPKVRDLVIWGSNEYNPYGHVAIISRVDADEIEIIQQNPGMGASTRATLPLVKVGNKWKIDSEGLSGWLRKEK